jgi:hypothetical protein
MVRIYKDKSGEFLVQTTCLDVDTFVSDLAEALGASLATSEDGELLALGALQNAMPIAFKLAGYKAETVQEQRTLICGRASPRESDIVVSVGR